jgi:thiol-disulfide isomerase/thioredoxin
VNFVTADWWKDHSWPGPADPAEKVRAFYRAYSRATDEWTRRWPNYPPLWFYRVDCLNDMEEVSPSEAEVAGEGLLRALAKNPDLTWVGPFGPILVAQLYERWNVKLDAIPQLVTQGFKESEDEFSTYSPEAKKLEQGNLNERYWIGWSTLADVYLKTNQPREAREVLIQIDAFLRKHQPDNLTPEGRRYFAEQSRTYWEKMGHLAELENRKLDALSYYQTALASISPPLKAGRKDRVIEEALKLWKELGGTDEGWQAWLAQAASKNAETQKTAEASWSNMEKPLPDFELPSIQGRTWRLTDLKGKVTFVNVWATWCSPCRAELPFVEKLYERLKDRSDVLVVTMDIDENPGLVEPFVKKNGFNFPVLLARSYIGPVGIPLNWITDRGGVVRVEVAGFGYDEAEWLKRVTELIEKAASP